MIICACSSPASAAPIAAQCGQRSEKRHGRRSCRRACWRWTEGTRLQVLFPAASARLLQRTGQDSPRESRAKKKAEPSPAPLDDQLKTRLFELRKRGFNRLYQDGQVFEFSTPESLLDVNFAEPVFLLVDRIAVPPESAHRVVDAIESAYREVGEVIFETAPRDERAPPGNLRFSQRFECKNCNLRYEEPEPRLFSFNNPYGACPRCQGFGNTIDFDLDLVIPDKAKTLAEGAIEPWTKPKYRPLFTELKRYARQAGIPLDIPWSDLEPEHQRVVIEGEGKFPACADSSQHLERKKYKLHVRVFLSRYRGYSLCSACNGSRLRLEARQVKIDGKNICEVCAMTVEDAATFFMSAAADAQKRPKSPTSCCRRFASACVS